MIEETDTKPAETGKPDAKVTGFKLDWETSDIRLKGGFVHTLGRPDAEMLLERDKEISTDVPIAKDGSFKLPDPTETEEIDAKYYDLIEKGATGYKGKVPSYHKAAAFQGLYNRAIYVDEDCDIFGDTIVVCEAIGDPDDPDFIIRHALNAPDEDDLRKLRKKLNNGRLAPDKRGRQKFVASSNLRTAMQYYSTWFGGIEGAHISGEFYSPERRQEFIDLVDPLIRMQVVKVLVEELTGNLLD